MSFNAIACSGQMIHAQNNIFNDNKHIQDITLKMDFYSDMQDDITNSLNFSKSVFDELTEGTKNASNTLLEISVNDATNSLNNAKDFLAQLKERGASASEIKKAEKDVQNAEDNLKNKHQELADAKNNMEALIQTSKTLSNQYFEKQKQTQLKHAQSMEKKLTIEKARWEKRLQMHEAELNGFKEGFKNAVQQEFTPNFAKMG
ncbi:MAG: hypothetical protein MJ229_04840 [bacterium]|nr:hypothetical protein [bacterium]